jgi:hypothetical protein
METENPATISSLFRDVVDDLRTIARDEAALARMEVGKSLERAAGDAAGVTLGGIVALIGFGMLCVAAVVALDEVIASLALRLLLMAIVYLIIGGGIAAMFGRRLRKDAVPDLSVVKYEARSTVQNLEEAVRHG